MTPERGAVVGLRGADPHELAPGVTMRPLFGDGAMLNLLEFEAGARVPVTSAWSCARPGPAR